MQFRILLPHNANDIFVFASLIFHCRVISCSAKFAERRCPDVHYSRMTNKVAITRTARRRNEKSVERGNGSARGGGQCAYLKSRTNRVHSISSSTGINAKKKKKTVTRPAGHRMPRGPYQDKKIGSCLRRNAVGFRSRAFSVLINEVSVTSGRPRVHSYRLSRRRGQFKAAVITLTRRAWATSRPATSLYKRRESNAVKRNSPEMLITITEPR